DPFSLDDFLDFARVIRSNSNRSCLAGASTQLFLPRNRTQLPSARSYPNNGKPTKPVFAPASPLSSLLSSTIHQSSILCRRFFPFGSSASLPAAAINYASARFVSNPAEGTDLKGIMAKKIVEHQKRVKEFRAAHGASVIGEITLD